MNNKLSDHQEKQTDLPMLTIRGRTTLPIVQGGMGVGISGWRLAGSVAREGGIGTLSAVGHPMTYAYKSSYLQTIKVINDVIKILDQEEKKMGKNRGNRAFFDAVKTQIFYNASLDCIGEEIQKAQKLSEDNGSIYINVMSATEDYERQVVRACEAGIHGIVSGAGYPLSLPNFTRNFPDVALLPILSNARGVDAIIRKWEKKWKRLPDAVVLEDPSRAGGHLGSKNIADIHNPETTLEHSIPETVQLFEKRGYQIPIIAAGGAADRSDIDRILALGASGVQMGTRFLATYESGASQKFKQDVIDAGEDDIIEYISSTMLPARALKKSGIFNTTKHYEVHVRKCVRNCLAHCAYRDGLSEGAQMCILNSLVNATQGNAPEADENGLEFVGVSALKIHELKSVEEVMNEIAYPKK